MLKMDDAPPKKHEFFGTVFLLTKINQFQMFYIKTRVFLSYFLSVKNNILKREFFLVIFSLSKIIF